MKESEIIKIISDILDQYKSNDVSAQSALSAINKVIENFQCKQ